VLKILNFNFNYFSISVYCFVVIVNNVVQSLGLGFRSSRLIGDWPPCGLTAKRIDRHADCGLAASGGEIHTNRQSLVMTKLSKHYDISKTMVTLRHSIAAVRSPLPTRPFTTSASGGELWMYCTCKSSIFHCLKTLRYLKNYRQSVPSNRRYRIVQSLLQPRPIAASTSDGETHHYEYILLFLLLKYQAQIMAKSQEERSFHNYFFPTKFLIWL